MRVYPRYIVRMYEVVLICKTMMATWVDMPCIFAYKSSQTPIMAITDKENLMFKGPDTILAIWMLVMFAILIAMNLAV